jgi:hypothetical protein
VNPPDVCRRHRVIGARDMHRAQSLRGAPREHENEINSEERTTVANNSRQVLPHITAGQRACKGADQGLRADDGNRTRVLSLGS